MTNAFLLGKFMPSMKWDPEVQRRAVVCRTPRPGLPRACCPRRPGPCGLEAAAGLNYGGEACGRGSGLLLSGSRAARPTERMRAGEGLEAERCGVHVSETGPRSAAGRAAVHHPSPLDITASVRKPTVATPGAGVSAIAPASFRHQRSQAGEEPSERTPWEGCVQRIHAFLPSEAS